MKWLIVTVCGEHFVSKNPFAIAVGSYENINKIIKCTNDVLFLREDRNVMLSGMGLEWLKQADSTYNVGVFARRGGGHLGGFLWSPYPDCQLHRERQPQIWISGTCFVTCILMSVMILVVLTWASTHQRDVKAPPHPGRSSSQGVGATLMVKCPSKLHHSVLMFVLFKLSRSVYINRGLNLVFCH